MIFFVIVLPAQELYNGLASFRPVPALVMAFISRAWLLFKSTRMKYRLQLKTVAPLFRKPAESWAGMAMVPEYMASSL